MFGLPLRHQRRQEDWAGAEGLEQARHVYRKQQQSYRRDSENVDRKRRLPDAAVQGRDRRQSDQGRDCLREDAVAQEQFAPKKKPPQVTVTAGANFSLLARWPVYSPQGRAKPRNLLPTGV